MLHGFPLYIVLNSTLNYLCRYYLRDDVFRSTWFSSSKALNHFCGSRSVSSASFFLTLTCHRWRGLRLPVVLCKSSSAFAYVQPQFTFDHKFDTNDHAWRFVQFSWLRIVLYFPAPLFLSWPICHITVTTVSLLGLNSCHTLVHGFRSNRNFMFF